MSKSRTLLINARFHKKYDADPHYMWDKPNEALRHARNARRLPHPCVVFERVYCARHGNYSNVRTCYMDRLQKNMARNATHISAPGFWRPKDRLRVTLPDGTVTLRAFVI